MIKRSCPAFFFLNLFPEENLYRRKLLLGIWLACHVPHFKRTSNIVYSFVKGHLHLTLTVKQNLKIKPPFGNHFFSHKVLFCFSKENVYKETIVGADKTLWCSQWSFKVTLVILTSLISLPYYEQHTSQTRMVFGGKKKSKFTQNGSQGKKMFNLASGWVLVAMETQLWIEWSSVLCCY